jgi:hypothetical protein
MPTTPDLITEFYNQNCQDEWQRLGRLRPGFAVLQNTLKAYPSPALVNAVERLIIYEPDHLSRLLHGEKERGVL